MNNKDLSCFSLGCYKLVQAAVSTASSLTFSPNQVPLSFIRSKSNHGGSLLSIVNGPVHSILDRFHLFNPRKIYFPRLNNKIDISSIASFLIVLKFFEDHN